MTDLPYQVLDLVKGEDNFFDVDLVSPVDIDGGDTVWFTAKYRKSDADGSAALSKSSTDPAQIEVTDGPNGKARVKCLAGETLALTGGGLIFDVKLKKVDVNPDVVQTVAHGSIRMVTSVNKSAA